MIVRLNEDNRLELSEKAMMVRDFRGLYKYYTDKLNDEERAMAAFGILYYMYFFDSQFLLDYPDDMDARLAAVKQFVYKGDKINTDTKVFRKAAETYCGMMDQEQSEAYVIMKGNFNKLKQYAKAMVLVQEDSPTEGEAREDVAPISQGIRVTFKEFTSVNASLPDQEKALNDFKSRLLQHFKSEIDIYGGGEMGAYERPRAARN